MIDFAISLTTWALIFLAVQTVALAAAGKILHIYGKSKGITTKADVIDVYQRRIDGIEQSSIDNIRNRCMILSLRNAMLWHAMWANN